MISFCLEFDLTYLYKKIVIMKKSICLFTLLFSCSSFLFAQTLVNKITPVNDYDIAYEEWQLDNGLTLIIHEDHSDPIVHVHVTYHKQFNSVSQQNLICL